MKNFKAMAHIHSLGGAMDEVTVLDSRQEADTWSISWTTRV